MILGLDVSTYTGWSKHWGFEYSHKPPEWVNGVTHFKDVAGMERVVMFSDWILARFEKWGLPELVVFEAPPTRAFNLRPLIEIGTILRVACHLHAVPFIEVSPTMLKKYVTGSGAAKKKDMLKVVREEWGCLTKDDNEADAFGLAMIGRALRGHAAGALPKFRYEVLNKLKGVKK